METFYVVYDAKGQTEPLSARVGRDAAIAAFLEVHWSRYADDTPWEVWEAKGYHCCPWSAVRGND